MNVQRVYVGGWFQRTGLHLAEIRDFLVEGASPLQDLDQDKLRQLQGELSVEKIEAVIEDLEFIDVTAGGVSIKIFEDGLITLGKNGSDNLKQDIADLTSYYEKKLSPAFSYLFSLGAPIPKELANIKTIYPYFVILKDASDDDVEQLLQEFDQEKHFEVKGEQFEIHRGDKLYIINNKSGDPTWLERFIQEQIFLREFKGQLHRYLNLHRIIWERIADVKERGKIRGKDIGALRDKVEGYSKTVNLIKARINQMGSYIRTREAIVGGSEEYAQFMGVLEYKYETLSDTLEYVKEIWSMTENYVQAALTQFSDLHSEVTEKSIENLTIVTTMGVGATLIGLFTDQLPGFTWYGVLYFFILVAIGFGASRAIKFIYNNKSYGIDQTEYDKDIT